MVGWDWYVSDVTTRFFIQVKIHRFKNLEFYCIFIKMSPGNSWKSDLLICYTPCSVEIPWKVVKFPVCQTVAILVFRMSTSCSNTWLKSIAKWYDCLNINELLQQIIPYHQQNVFQLGNVGQLWRVSVIVFHHCASYMIIHWHISRMFFLIFTSESLINHLST